VDDGDARTEARTLRRAVAQLQRSLRTSRSPESPTPSQLSALGTLLRDGALATGELAARERLKPQSVTRLVAALLEQRLIERVVDERDRRRLVVAITPEGKRRVEAEMQRRDARLAHALSALSEAERATLRSAAGLLERLAYGTNE